MPDLISTNETQRDLAMERFHILRPFLEDNVPLSRVAQHHGLALRTLQTWVARYRSNGLTGLCRKEYSGKGKSRFSVRLKETIEGLALQKPPISVAALHRKIATLAIKLGEAVPSYDTVYQLVRKLDPALVKMAHEGARIYSEAYDLLYRREASRPNEIWQADHTELDIWILDKDGTSKKPWLTIILDDYSRAVAGYYLTFFPPSAQQTSLALRQAIWRKAQAGWRVYGIPQILYTDHGSDFTSSHLEQVLADLKIQSIFSGAGRPRGRGKVERFFSTVNQVFLSRFPGYAPSGQKFPGKLTLLQLNQEFESFLLTEYLVTPHSATEEAPQARWQAGGFLPQMPISLEQLDLLLLTVAKTRRVQQDGIRFMGLRYISPTLAAYVGEQVLLRYDPRDMAEVRVYHHDRFVCKAICQEIAGETVPYREIVRARNHRRRELRQRLSDRGKVVDSLLAARNWTPQPEAPATQTHNKPVKPKRTIKRYRDE